MGFIKLTSYIDNMPILFNINHLTSVYVSDEGKTRVITTDCCENEYYEVKESVQEIIDMLNPICSCTGKTKSDQLTNLNENKGMFTF